MALSKTKSEPVHAIILTLNEEAHVKRCIESLIGNVDTITVVDSGSSDATIDIVLKENLSLYSNPWKNYSTQMNFAIDKLKGREGWILRIDADEVFSMDGVKDLRVYLRGIDQNCKGLLLQRRIFFLGRRMRRGGIEPSWQLRLWRNGHGRCEDRWMDEHIVVDGAVQKSKLVVSDVNLNSLTWWSAKHNGYASREAVDLLNARYSFMKASTLPRSGVSPQARARRFLKEKIYRRIPLGVRGIVYFIYRYVFLLGFLDGRAGFYFHFLQGLWYRVLVDAKVYEIETHSLSNDIGIIEAIKDKTGIDVI